MARAASRGVHTPQILHNSMLASLVKYSHPTTQLQAKFNILQVLD